VKQKDFDNIKMHDTTMKISDKITEKIKAHILFAVTFFLKNRAVYDNMEK